MNSVFNSIRWRIQAVHGLILIAVLIGFEWAAYQVVWDNQLRRIDGELAQKLTAISRPLPSDRGGPREMFGGQKGLPPWSEPMAPSGPPPDHHSRERFESRRSPGPFRSRLKDAIQLVPELVDGQTNVFYYVLWQTDGALSARSHAAPAEIPRPEPGDLTMIEPRDGGEPWQRQGPPRPFEPSGFRSRGTFREAFRFLASGDCVLAGRSISPDIHGMRRLALLFTVAGGGILLLGLAGGWWVATRAIQPIEEISAAAIKIADGDLSHRISAADRDSELGQLADVLNSTFARLEAAFTNQARFTSDASHELRTPVSVILSETQSVLARERTPGEYREALETCQRAAQRMRRLTGSLLELARFDAGQVPLGREAIDLARVAQDCTEQIRPLADRGIRIRTRLDPAPCVGDTERIGQVITNLLSNALYYNRDGGEVSISTGTEGDSALVVVTDNGPGIAPEDLPHVFERFYRADNSRTSASGRTGLGLAISKAIVEAHAGLIEADSQPGAGATFTVRLHRRMPSADTETAPEQVVDAVNPPEIPTPS